MMFFFGFLFGVTTAIIIGFIYATWKLNQIQTKLDEAKKKFTVTKDSVRNKLDSLENKRESIIDRLKQAQAITQQQLDLGASAEQPSKNALHSRYKNGLVGEIKKLEDDKLKLLQSILDDGFDPLITVIDSDGTRQELPLSHFVNSKEAGIATSPNPDTSKRTGKFVVLKGGKDDGTVH